MAIIEGDVYVFTKMSNTRSEHFNNFNLGQKYEVQGTSVFGGYGDEDVYYGSSIIVYFRETKYAVYENELDLLFTKLEDYRSERIDLLDL